MTEPTYLQELNSRQKEAVLAINGPVLIVAGAGAGKTKTLTHRILHLIHQGVAPSEILAITFTNKAAHEMKERMEKLLQSDQTLNLPIQATGRPFLSTFHSLGVHIIRENAQVLGLSRNFTIFDKNDSRRAVKEALESANIDPKQFDPGKIQNFISREKGKGRTVADFAGDQKNEYIQSIVVRAWDKYEGILKREKSLDFDDLLLHTLKLLQNHAHIREHYQNVWKYVHIDEYQDTNKVQYLTSKILAEKSRNICVVGDVDQNIYSWRGADIQNILSFEEDYPEAKVILLEENYRSTQNILSAANTVIKKNKLRRDKNLFTNNPVGEKIALFEGYDEADEAYFVAQTIKNLIADRTTRADEIAILYRANFQSRIIEEALLHFEVPYHVLGTRFYERKEIKDALSYVRASLNPDSLSDVKRIINVPVRGIGKVTIAKMFSGMEEGLPAATRAKIQIFRNLLTEIAKNVAEKKPSEVFTDLIKKIGLEESLDDGTDEGVERVENIKELVTLATKYDDMPIPTGIEKMLEESALASDQDSLIKKQTESVKVMTVHAAKGLEFDRVFITGLEENLFPHKRMGSDDGEQDIEEERRLFYVALTRARKKLYLCYASIRTIFGSKQMNIPSEFLGDIDESLVEQENWPAGSSGRPFKVIKF